MTNNDYHYIIKNEHRLLIGGSCVQIKKDTIRQQIIDSGKSLFMEFGFRNTSMRQVAKNSSVSTANIYNYFQNKDDLFKATVQNAIDSYTNLLDVAFEEKTWADKSSWLFSAEVARFHEFVDVIYNYQDEFMILFSKSEGSIFENYDQKIIDLQSTMSQQVNDQMTNTQNGFLKKPVPDFIVRTSARMYMDLIIGGLQNGLSKEIVKERVVECVYFLFYGYMGYFSDELRNQQEVF